MRRLAPLSLLLLLGLAPPAQAVPITGYASGRIAEDLAEGEGVPRTFTVGEAVSLRFTYNLDPPGQPPGVDVIDIAWEVHTAGGYRDTVDWSSVAIVTRNGDALRVFSATDPWSYDLRLVGDTGTFEFAREVPGMGSWGFRAAVHPRDTFVPVTAVPEPSTLAMGLLGGVAVLGLAARRWT